MIELFLSGSMIQCLKCQGWTLQESRGLGAPVPSMQYWSLFLLCVLSVTMAMAQSIGSDLNTNVLHDICWSWLSVAQKDNKTQLRPLVSHYFIYHWWLKPWNTATLTLSFFVKLRWVETCNRDTYTAVRHVEHKTDPQVFHHAQPQALNLLNQANLPFWFWMHQLDSENNLGIHY